MEELHQTLMHSGVAALGHAAAIAGLGGIGKTQTAIEYAYHYFYDDPTYDWVFWVTADTELNLVTGLAKIGESLHLGGSSLDEMAQQTSRWLETNPRWLLIFDNADQLELIQPWLPRNPQGRVLVTSRAQEGFVRLGIKTPIAVPALSLEESLCFLFERTEQLSALATPADQVAATALARELAGLPLALEQAVAYIQRRCVSFAVYWKHYQRKRLLLLEQVRPETGDYPQSVATTWLLNFEAVEERLPAAVLILRLSAVLAADDIAEELLLVCAEEFGLEDCTDELALAEQLAALADFSLIQRERATASYSIHRMVQEVVWHNLTPVEQENWLQRAITGLNAAFPSVEFANWHLCDQLVPHVQAIATRSEAVTIETLNWARLLNQAAYYLQDQGRYGEAEPLYRQSLHITEQQLGADHPTTATSLNNLAVLYRDQERYGEAEPLYLRSLYIREQKLGEGHSDTAASLNNLAGAYYAQGRYGEAEPLYLRSLYIRERKLGEDHSDTADSLNNLAELYRVQGRHDEAEPLYLRSLHIREKKSGKDHPDVATSLNNLAGLYYSQGRYDEVENLLVRSLHIREKKSGKDHHYTAISLHNLAGLYDSQGRYDKSEPLYLRSLVILNTLGENYPHTQTVWRNFRYLVQKVVEAGRENELSDHPFTRSVLQQIREENAES